MSVYVFTGSITGQLFYREFFDGGEITFSAHPSAAAEHKRKKTAPRTGSRFICLMLNEPYRDRRLVIGQHTAQNA